MLLESFAGHFNKPAYAMTGTQTIAVEFSWFSFEINQIISNDSYISRRPMNL